MGYADMRDVSRESLSIDEATRLKRKLHDVGLDAGERTLLRSVERGEWTTVARFRAAEARDARVATTTLRRLRLA